MEMVVYFGMAQKLKKAGFPQPKFAPGQTWYNHEGIRLQTELIAEKLIFRPWDKNMLVFINMPPTAEAFFAPTAEKILANLPESYRKLTNEPVTEVIEFDTRETFNIADANAYGQMWLDENNGPDDNDGVEWLDMKAV